MVSVYWSSNDGGFFGDGNRFREVEVENEHAILALHNVSWLWACSFCRRSSVARYPGVLRPKSKNVVARIQRSTASSSRVGIILLRRPSTTENQPTSSQLLRITSMSNDSSKNEQVKSQGQEIIEPALVIYTSTESAAYMTKSFTCTTLPSTGTTSLKRNA